MYVGIYIYIYIYIYLYIYLSIYGALGGCVGRTSFCSACGPLQSTLVASPPQHALPAAMPTRFSDVLNGAVVKM